MLLPMLLAVQGAVSSFPVLSQGALFDTPVGGLERTGGTSARMAVSDQPFPQAIRVKIQETSVETNATQLTLANDKAVAAGDVLIATFWVRGKSARGGAGHIEFLFEKATDPWTKSVIRDVETGSDWKRIQVPFAAAEAYAPGAAMASFRFAFGPQVVDLGGVDVEDFGKSMTLEDATDSILKANPVGDVDIAIDVNHPAQVMWGLGGDFCQARYGSSEVLDKVGEYVLDHMPVRHARVGLPLNYWEPHEGEFDPDHQAGASLQLLTKLTAKGIPIVLSVWEGPTWLQGGAVEQSGRILAPDKYDACVEAIAKYLVLAKEKYAAKVDYISFNEPDYGVNFKFSSGTMRDFIRKAGPRFDQLGLTTKFVVGDTGGGAQYASYAEPILSDQSIAKYLGPIAFHCWDVLTATEQQYEAIRELGKRFHKPVWCLEAGHDAGLWQKPNPWSSWDNAFSTALAYEKTLRLSGAELMDYWTYENNYPLVDQATGKPYRVFDILQWLSHAFDFGAKVVPCLLGSKDVHALAGVSKDGATRVLIINECGDGAAVIHGLKESGAYEVAVEDRHGHTSSRVAADASGTLHTHLPIRSVVLVAPAPA